MHKKKLVLGVLKPKTLSLIEANARTSLEAPINSADIASDCPTCELVQVPASQLVFKIHVLPTVAPLGFEISP